MAHDADELEALRGALYREADMLADAWRRYADELLTDLVGDEESDGRRRVLDAQSCTHDAFGVLEKMVRAAHPERSWWVCHISTPPVARRAIRRAGITTLGELIDAWWAGELGELPGVGPVALADIGRGLAKLNEEGLMVG